MKEKNHKSLKSALEQLSGLDAPAGIWNQIQQELDHDISSENQEKNKQVLKQAIEGMPVYTAPTRIWTRIKGQLNGPVRNFRPLSLVAAASLLIGLSIWAWLAIRPDSVAPSFSEQQNEAHVELQTAEDVSLAILLEKEPDLAPCLNTQTLNEKPSLRPTVAALTQVWMEMDSLSALNQKPGSELASQRAKLVEDLQKAFCH